MLEHLDKIDKQSQNNEKKLVTYTLLMVEVLVWSETWSEWNARGTCYGLVLLTSVRAQMYDQLFYES